MSALHDLGHDVLGPALCFHVHRVIRRSDDLGLDRLYFVARDGYLLQRVHEILGEQVTALRRPRASYLHLSRRSTALPSVRCFGAREIEVALLRSPTEGLAGILGSFDVDDQEIRALLARAGADMVGEEEGPAGGNRVAGGSKRERRIEQAHRAFGKAFSDARVQAAIASRVERSRALLRVYLEQEGLFASRRTGFVDVGWTGTILNNLHRAFADDPMFPEVHGLFLGLYANRLQECDAGLAGRMQGSLYDHRRSRRMTEWAPMHFVEIFEQSTRAFEGTTLSYRAEGDHVVPVLKEAGPDREAERLAEPAIHAIQRGVLAYAGDYGRYIELCDLPTEALREEIKRRLERFIFRPTRREIDAVARLSHTDDWGSLSYGGLVPDGGPAALLRPRTWLRRFYRSYWKPAYITRTGGPLLARLFHIYESTKLRWRR